MQPRTKPTFYGLTIQRGRFGPVKRQGLFSFIRFGEHRKPLFKFELGGVFAGVRRIGEAAAISGRQLWGDPAIAMTPTSGGSSPKRPPN
jgi:hypothetical protein